MRVSEACEMIGVFKTMLYKYVSERKKSALRVDSRTHSVLTFRY